ncbi:MAG: hypothetical protein ACHQ1D_03270 [Nitrososphaerales archaeon]
MNTKNDYNSISTSVSKGNNRLDDIKSCLAARTHKPQCDHKLLENINKDRLAFIEGSKNCKDCQKELEKEYSQLLNKAELSVTFAHCLDIIDAVELSNKANSAHCEHKDPHELQEGYKGISNDFDASVRDRKYLANIKNEYAAVEYLKEQKFTITDADYDSDIKYIVRLPESRVSITEEESKALSLLSNRPIICNFQDRLFWVLCDNKCNEVKK